MENETEKSIHYHESTGQVQSPASYLAQEYARWQALFEAQPALVRSFLVSQARSLADTLIEPQTQARFTLPDRVVVQVPSGKKTETFAPVPEELREQMVGGLMERLTRADLSAILRQRLDELEASTYVAVATSAGLIRFATAIHLVHDVLPSGRSVTYIPAEGEETPTIPVASDQEVASALTARTDAVLEEPAAAEEPAGAQEEERGELLVPYVPAARRFYLPQWVAFDDQDHLLVSSVNQAEATIASMQRYLRILHTAIALAPYMVADEQYRSKRYGMLGQLINQGRALARHETGEIIATIRRRAAANDLNRGLSLSLPYFDDQALEMRSHDFDLIPAGRVMFVPSFVVLASRKEQVKVGQDTRLSRSTRNHLLKELQMLEFAFDTNR